MPATALESVLRRDRIIVATALVALAALAWAYILWLAADMSMGGMDMTGFRMIPAGMGMMMPAQSPWRLMEFTFVLAMWTVMMSHDGALGGADDPDVRASADRRRRRPRRSPRPAGSSPAISWPGPPSPLQPPSSNGGSSAPFCSMPRWQARAIIWAASC
jgi:hypothetical protein